MAQVLYNADRVILGNSKSSENLERCKSKNNKLILKVKMNVHSNKINFYRALSR